MRPSLTPILVLACSALPLQTTPAGAQSKKQCAHAYERAQVLRQDEKLSEARAELGICASQACPARMRDECTAWSGEIEKEMPSVIVSFRTAGEGDIPGARLSIDGKLLTETLDATPIRLDPGKHVIRLEAPGHPAQEREIAIGIGETERKVDFVAEARPRRLPATARKKRTPVRESRRALPTSVWLLGAVGVVGIGVGTYVGLGALARRSDLRNCKPECSKEDVDRVERDYVISEIAIGAAALALGGALFIAVKNGNESPHVGFALGSSGGSAAVRGRF